MTDISTDHDPTIDDVAEISYRREGESIRLKLHSNSQELRQVMIGLWSRLPVDQREDFVRELRHYLLPGSRLSMVAAAVKGDASDPRITNMIDVQRMVDQEMREA